MTKGNEISRKNERVNDNIFLTSRIKIWIHTEWSEQSRGPAKAACDPGPVMMWIFEFPTDSTVANTELSEGSFDFDHQSGSFDFCEWFMGIIQVSFNTNFEAPSFKNDKLW